MKSSRGFVPVFGAAYLVLHVAYLQVPTSFLVEVAYRYAIVQPAAVIVAWLAPGEAVQVIDNQLRSAHAVLEIVRGCDGAGLLFLLVAAIVAVDASPGRKLAGALGGGVMVFALNELRIVGLYFIAAHHHTLFVPLHVYFIPMLEILACAAYFAWWLNRWSPAEDHVDPEQS
ncbi:MAG: exosortase family protein XrtM [Gammaproteobacteria bacterium]